MERLSGSFMGAARVAALSVLLSACGGGGGGGDSSPPPPPNLASAPGAATINAFVQVMHSNILNATDSNGNRWMVQISFVPNSGTTTFNGTANAHSTVRTVAVFENGALVANSISTGYFLLNPYVPLGSISTTGVTSISSNVSALPTTITVGQSGAVDTITDYHNSTLTTVDATEVETFSVQADNSTAVLFCFNSVTSNVSAQGAADGFVADTESDCYAVDTLGNASVAKIVLTVNGVTLTFQ
jgi:hypothetical protein